MAQSVEERVVLFKLYPAGPVRAALVMELLYGTPFEEALNTIAGRVDGDIGNRDYYSISLLFTFVDQREGFVFWRQIADLSQKGASAVEVPI